MADLAILLELSSAAIALLGGSLRLRRVDLAVFGGARLAGAEPERRTGQTAVTETLVNLVTMRFSAGSGIARSEPVWWSGPRFDRVQPHVILAG